MSDLGIFGYLSNCIILCKNEMSIIKSLDLRPKMSFWVILGWISKKVFSYLKSSLNLQSFKQK